MRSPKADVIRFTRPQIHPFQDFQQPKKIRSPAPERGGGQGEGFSKRHLKSKTRFAEANRVLCWHYLFSRAVASQVSWAGMSLTTVFGMGTGGPSPQSTPTAICIRTPALRYRSTASAYIHFNALSMFRPQNAGDPYRIRTDVNGVRGRCLNHLTNGPFGAPSRTRTGDPLIKSQLLYQLS